MMISIRPAHTVLLLLFAATVGCASAKGTPPLVTIQDAAPGAAEARSGLRFQVERNGLSKKVLFRDLETSRAVAMQYKGMPVAWGSPLNLLVDEDLYERASHRVLYRFQHPRSARPMAVLARAKSHRVASVPVRADDSTPIIELFEGEDKKPRGTLRYDFNTRILFSGAIEGRRVEIERMSEDTVLDKGLLSYLLFPFPLSGAFVIRVDGQEAARFTQHRQHGVKSPYDLDLDGETDLATRDVAMLAFVVFDLMKDFVNSSR
jgi:hypothetical protein